MAAGDQYRHKSAELETKARESEPRLRAELEQLARSYRRLAEQADRNNQAIDAAASQPKSEG